MCQSRRSLRRVLLLTFISPLVAVDLRHLQGSTDRTCRRDLYINSVCKFRFIYHKFCHVRQCLATRSAGTHGNCHWNGPAIYRRRFDCDTKEKGGASWLGNILVVPLEDSSLLSEFTSTRVCAQVSEEFTVVVLSSGEVIIASLAKRPRKKKTGSSS